MSNITPSSLIRNVRISNIIRDIQVTCNTLRGFRHCHQKQMGKEGGQPKCHVTFLYIFKQNLSTKVLKKLCFVVKCTVSRHMGEGDHGTVSPIVSWEREGV